MSFFITRTPFRISFFGGGTDYPEWYMTHGGAVLSTTIDKYCYISCRFLPPFFDIRHRIVWSHIETVNSIAEILHPAVREGLKALDFDDSRGLEIHHQADLPARTGTGSSSSFAVGLIKVLSALKGRDIAHIELANAAIDLERNRLKENVGTQDQTAAAVGGFNIIQFRQGGDIEVARMRMSPARIEELERSLLLIFTGTSRLSTTIASSLLKNLNDRADELHAMRRLVDRAAAKLENGGSLDEFGLLLNETWQLKRSLSDKISTNRIDQIYRQAIDAGALGGKLLGAGGSGFMLLYVPSERQEAVRSALPGYLEVPFGFEDEPCTIIHRPTSVEYQ
jgi:D-glycero-alpha-D-manno-heptose-7-phosphate kinase